MDEGRPNSTRKGVPRIERLRARSYRALRDVDLRDLTPLTALVGPNGSGKSTVFDVFAFLSECLTQGLRPAWDRRNRFKELRTRGEDGPIVFDLKYREGPASPAFPLITYHLAVNEDAQGPYVAEERLRWTRKRGKAGRPFDFLRFAEGSGEVASGEMPDEDDERVPEKLESRELLAVSTLGQLAKHPRVGALRRFITGWHLSYLTADSTRGVPEAGPKEHLSPSGDNLPNVMQYLKERHPQQLERILAVLRQRVPRLDRVEAEVMQDGRLLLTLKDAPFEQPILARFVSDGTLKMLAYLTVLYDPSPPQLVGVEEPENHLHPRLLPELAEECRGAAARTQLIVTTHSPFFVNALGAEEVWVLYRDAHGFTQARRASEMPGIEDLVASGGKLGRLWVEGFFDAGDPLTQSGDLLA
jgi:predicted ATPase